MKLLAYTYTSGLFPLARLIFSFILFVCFLSLASAQTTTQTSTNTDTTQAQLANSTTPPASILRLDRDTSLLWEGRNSRIGFNSFVYDNRFTLGLHRKNTLTQALFGQTFLYNNNAGTSATSGKNGRFVQQDYQLKFRQLFFLPQITGLYLGHLASGQWYAANGNRLGLYAGLAGIQGRKGRFSLNTESFAGGATDTRGAIENHGLTWGARVSGQKVSPDSGTPVSFLAGLTRTFINPRQAATLFGVIQAMPTFGPGTRMPLAAAFTSRRVEDYIPVLIQKIRTDSLQLAAGLVSELSSRWYFRSDNSLLGLQRVFSFRPFGESLAQIAAQRQTTSFRQLEIATRQELTYQSLRWRNTASFSASQRIRSYDLANNLALSDRNYERARLSEHAKDIQEQTYAWLFSSIWQASRKATFSGNYTARLFRVNTPSELNDQDRDELLYASDLSWQYRWSGVFRTNIRSSASYKDIIFIRPTQSGQNFTERILRLEPSALWQLGPLSWQSSYSLWATYNVRRYDSEAEKNRSNRIWILQHNLSLRLPQGFAAKVDLLRRENRIAQLNWVRFSENPIDTVVITEFHPRLGRSWVPVASISSSTWQLTTEAGYKLFRQSRRYLAGLAVAGSPTRQIALHTITVQHGPSANMQINWPGRGSINADCWAQWQVVRNRYRISEQPFIGASFRQTDLDRVTTQFYFFFNLSGSLLF
jgi:hypothetical protein